MLQFVPYVDEDYACDGEMYCAQLTQADGETIKIPFFVRLFNNSSHNFMKFVYNVEHGIKTMFTDCDDIDDNWGDNAITFTYDVGVLTIQYYEESILIHCVTIDVTPQVIEALHSLANILYTKNSDIDGFAPDDIASYTETYVERVPMIELTEE